MSLLRLTFAGQIKRAEHKTVGDKQLAEVSICKKQKGRGDAQETYCWIRVGIWSPPEWMIAKLVKGAFIAGTGEFSSRSYEGKDGKATSLEVRCQSFDVEIEGGAADPAAAPAPRAAPRAAAPAAGSAGGAWSDDDAPPFAPAFGNW